MCRRVSLCQYYTVRALGKQVQHFIGHVSGFPQLRMRMSLPVWCMLVLLLCSSSKGMVVDKVRLARLSSHQMEKEQKTIQALKRHSDGTFSSDFTNYLDKIKAKDFVEWLASTKLEGCHKDLLHNTAAEV